MKTDAIQFSADMRAKGYVYINDHWEKPKFLPTVKGEPDVVVMLNKPAKRIRQSAKPVMNGLESEFYMRLICEIPPNKIKAQAVTLKLANGLRYTMDFFAFHDGQMRGYEVKGDWIDGDSVPKLKMAASMWPEIHFELWWKDKQTKVWKSQNVLP